MCVAWVKLHVRRMGSKMKPFMHATTVERVTSKAVCIGPSFCSFCVTNVLDYLGWMIEVQLLVQTLTAGHS